MSVKAISAKTETIGGFLGETQTIPFVIPEFQRPYAWGEEEVSILFDDLRNFASHIDDIETNTNEYFLGSIVTYPHYKTIDEKQVPDFNVVIDGQQRITSLFLLLRAIYDMLLQEYKKNGSDLLKKKMNKISYCLWKVPKKTEEPDTSSPLLSSKAIGDKESTVLTHILTTGEVDKKAKDNYSKNFQRFQELIISDIGVFGLPNFVSILLDNVTVLPVEATDLETALEIFTTLNNRGMPLSDSDVFKAQLYSMRKENHTEDAFIEQWKLLEERAKDVGESVRDLFYYYMFFLRAEDWDAKSTTLGLRKYFLDNQKNSRLFNTKHDIIADLIKITDLWDIVKNSKDLEKIKRRSVNEPWCTNTEILKALDTLSSYPNEFWKYPVIIFFLQHRQKGDFEIKFLSFLHKLTRNLVLRYIQYPSISGIKSAILKLNAQAFYTDHPKFEFDTVDGKTREKLGITSDTFEVPHYKLVRMILSIHAYSNEKQEALLPNVWHIEHILPRSNDFANVFHMSPEDLQKIVEHIGNKVAFEDKLNITASNKYFLNKIKEYLNSSIADAKDLATSNPRLEAWKEKEIYRRDVEVFKRVMNKLDDWEKEYENPAEAIKKPNPTAQ